MKKDDDERRKQKLESDTEGLLIQAEAARRGCASPVGGAGELQIVLQRNSILNPYQ